MTRTRAPQGFVLLVVLAAAAVLSLIAAFIYTRTEDQLILSVAAKGQTVASTRATLAAERKLAMYRANYPSALLNPLAAVPNYAQAQNPLPPLPAVPQIADRELADYEAVALPADGGANWCVETWKMSRGTGVQPWTVIEAYGFYGTSPGGFNGCVPQGNDQIVTSHVTVFLETPATTGSSTNNPGGPAGGTGTVGGA